MHPPTLRASAARPALWVALAATLALAACSSTPAPREQMAVAKSTVDQVTTAPGTAAAAPAELQSARDKLARAERAMASKDYDEARRLAEQAQADAKLAEAKSQEAHSERALRELQDSMRALNEELQRRAPPPPPK